MAQLSTVPAVRARKGGVPLVMVTAYDAPTARIADEAGVDMILVGDSVAMVVLGYDDTLSVTVADMVHHTAAVARTRPRPLIVADLPVVGHLGLTPQSLHARGGFKVQGKDAAAAHVLVEDAEALAEAGCFAL